MTEALRAFPDGASVIVPELAKNLDWPGADDIAEKLEAKSSGQLPPEVTKMIEQGKQELAKKDQEIAALKGDRSMDQAELAAKIEQARVEAEAQEQIELIRIASQERIANNKIQSEARLSAFKAKLQADAIAAQPQPQPAKAA
jgi:hypothetical protein